MHGDIVGRKCANLGEIAKLDCPFLQDSPFNRCIYAFPDRNECYPGDTSVFAKI